MWRPFPVTFRHFTHISLRRRLNDENFNLITSYQTSITQFRGKLEAGIIEVYERNQTSFALLQFFVCYLPGKAGQHHTAHPSPSLLLSLVSITQLVKTNHPESKLSRVATNKSKTSEK